VPSQVEPDTSFAHRLDAAIDASFWGIVCAKAGGRVLHTACRGNAGVYGRDVDPQTRFEISSVSKPFTAAAILKLREQGLLDLDDPLARFVANVPADKSAITVRDLLAHTSGVDPDFGIDYDSTLNREQFLARVMASRLASRPGAHFDYANVNYSLLAALVEIAADDEFENVMHRLVFEPAGLTATGFIQDRRFSATDRDCIRCEAGKTEGTASEWYWGWGYRGMGGIVTTAGDLMQWDAALKQGDILGAASLQDMYTPGPGDYGLGWFVEQCPRGHLRTWHDGSVFGFASLFVRYPHKDAALVVLTNADGDIEAIEEAFEDALVECGF
jgi:CubicO group peptidase (beta-lactamase class C family)